jgi:hypothetical protein
MSNNTVEGIRKYINKVYSGELIGISNLADYCHESEGSIMKSLVKLEMIREIIIVTKYFCPDAHLMEDGRIYCSACDQKYSQEMIYSLVYCELI